ncbi:MAG: DegT/DnrJ/EryC1/StrS family aminotransferase [Sulfurimonadaceae bacterium]
MTKLIASTYPLELPTLLSENAVEELEKALAAFLGYKEVIVLNAIESAFSLALSTLEKESGVLCSPNAPIALFSALHHHDLKAEYCDLKLDGTMETRFFHKSKTDHSKALVLSHNHGILSDCKQAALFTEESGMTLIEDATQAFSKREKSEAELVIYSLDVLVPSSLANGAFIATDNEPLATSLRHKAKGGYAPKKFWNYDLINTDANLSLAPLTAQLALDALTHIDKREQRIKEIQSTYLEKLSSNRLIELPRSSNLVANPLFPIALVPALFCPKEDIYQALVEAGIPIKVGNKPIYKTTLFKDEALSLFGAEEVFKAQLLLPSHHLMTPDDVTFTVETLESLLETYGYRGCSF